MCYLFQADHTHEPAGGGDVGVVDAEHGEERMDLEQGSPLDELEGRRVHLHRHQSHGLLHLLLLPHLLVLRRHVNDALLGLQVKNTLAIRMQRVKPEEIKFQQRFTYQLDLFERAGAGWRGRCKGNVARPRDAAVRCGISGVDVLKRGGLAEDGVEGQADAAAQDNGISTVSPN